MQCGACSFRRQRQQAENGKRRALLHYVTAQDSSRCRLTNLVIARTLILYANVFTVRGVCIPWHAVGIGLIGLPRAKAVRVGWVPALCLGRRLLRDEVVGEHHGLGHLEPRRSLVLQLPHSRAQTPLIVQHPLERGEVAPERLLQGLHNTRRPRAASPRRPDQRAACRPELPRRPKCRSTDAATTTQQKARGTHLSRSGRGQLLRQRLLARARRLLLQVQDKSLARLHPLGDIHKNVSGWHLCACARPSARGARRRAV